MATPGSREVVVVGAGIAGLTAAYELTGGRVPLGTSGPLVTVIETSERVGGKLEMTTVGGIQVDAGPDGVLARRREAVDLCEELGLSGDLRPIAASGASVWARGRLRSLPENLQLGIPTDWNALRRSRVLSPAGLLRALLDVIAPRPASRGPLQDRTIGALVGRKLGPEVVSTLVDPMIGGIIAGRVAEMSAAAMFPPLLSAAQQRGGLMAALRHQSAPVVPGPAQSPSGDSKNGTDAGGDGTEAPAFVTLEAGMGSLPDVLRALLESRGVRFVMGTEISSLRRQQGTPTSWAVESAATTTSADAVILATPSAATASILRPLDPEVAALLDQIEYSSVGVITFEFSEGTVTLPEHGTGVLVPPGTPIPIGPRAGERFLTTALTFLDRKWPHQKRPGRILLRTSVGRIDDTRMASLSDEALTAAALDEMAVLFDGVGVPLASRVSRWNESLPQYRVNHLMRVAGIEAGVARLPGLAVCGAAYRGVGVPACIASGRAAGRSISSALNLDR